uniref:Uncharacterized protein n=1 Tax=Chlorobium chlorochromatii (strain CaD3) TaxID=340177 RepID=Q3APT8_CHLCH
MNERVFLKILLTLLSSGAIAEVMVVLLLGWHGEALLFVFFMSCFAVAIALVLHKLYGTAEASGAIESVSARRVRAMQSEELRSRLGAYSVDDEFLAGTPLRAKSTSSTYEKSDVEAMIRKFAPHVGGLSRLLQMVQERDEASFAAVAKQAGLANVERQTVIDYIHIMLNAEKECESNTKSGEATSPLTEFTMERESFDSYIQRCMSGEGDDGDLSDELSVGLENPLTPKSVGIPPSDFSHSPTSIMESLKKRAGRVP